MKLNPQLQNFLDEMAEIAAPELHTVPVEVARAMYAKGTEMTRGGPPEPAAIENLSFPGPESVLHARLYRPVIGDRLPLLIFFHGGGFCIGSVETHDAVCRHLCVEGECLVLSVDYRLAPEHPFPAAVEDAWAACKWARDHADFLRADSERIAVGGDSAGGNLAAVSCLRARETGEMKIAFQLLIYPATELSASFPSHKKFATGYRLTAELIRWFNNHYFVDGADRGQWLASPLNAESLSELPPAFILSAGYDPLQDEDKAYAEKLRAGGVAVAYSHYDDMIHGFITMPGILDRCLEALSECALQLRNAFQVETKQSPGNRD